MTFKKKEIIVIILIIPFAFFGCNLKSNNIKTLPGNKKPQSISEAGKTTNAIKEIEKNDIYQVGIASWYGDKFHGKRTSNGEVYNMNMLTAAHKKLPFNTIVEVENLDNRRKVLVRINDRGPFVKDRIIDLSYEAAKKLGMDDVGTAPVVLRILKSSEFVNNGKVVYTDKTKVEQMKYYLQAGAFKDIKNAESLLFNVNESSGKIVFRIIFKDGFYKVVSESVRSKNKLIDVKNILDNIGYKVIVIEVRE